jgi:hypothetical protein
MEYTTPKPTQKKKQGVRQSVIESEDSQTETDNEEIPMDYTTPKPMKKKKRVQVEQLMESGDSLTETDDKDFETPKALKQKNKTTSLSDADSSDVEIVDAGVDFMDQGEPSEDESVGEEFNKKSDSQKLRSVDLSKFVKHPKTAKDKKAFRNEVASLKQALNNKVC